MSNEDLLLNNLSEALCCLEKEETLIKLLQQTMVETLDFSPKDSLNICSLIQTCNKNIQKQLNDIQIQLTEKNIVD